MSGSKSIEELDPVWHIHLCLQKMLSGEIKFADRRSEDEVAGTLQRAAVDLHRLQELLRDLRNSLGVAAT